MTDEVQADSLDIEIPAELEADEAEGELVLEINGHEVSPPPEEDDDIADVPDDAPNWAKNLRDLNKTRAKELKQKEREASELKERLARLEQQQQAPAPAAIVPDVEPPKPVYYDFATDDEFSNALDKWRDDCNAVQQKRAQIQQRQQAESEAVKKLVDGHKAKIAALKVPDFEQSAARVAQAMPPDLQLVILRVAEDSAKVVYALDKSPDLLKQISGIKDPVELAAAVARLESKIQVKRRKADAPAPNKPIGGGGVSSKGLQSQMDKALNDGNISEYRRLKKLINSQ
jgi:hypothetical protein